MVLLIAACGTVPVSSTLPLPSPPTEALKPWAPFPANASPRPLILFEDTVEHLGPQGFSAEPERKVDWGCNKFVFAPGATLSQGVAPHEVGAAQAFRALMIKRSEGGPASSYCAGTRPFTITAVRHVPDGFLTDRGTRQLPAWLFDIPEVSGYIGYLALDKSSLWGGALAVEGRGAQLSAGGRTLKVPVANNGPGPCESDYTAAAAESPTAVAVAVRQFPHATSGACPLVLRVGYISLELKAPLGGRVLVDEKGMAGVVCPEAATPGGAKATC